MAIVREKESKPKPKLTEGLAVNTVASRFDWFRNWALPNTHLCGGEMDLAVITPAGYLWEVEVKLTLSDWRADEKKAKWRHPDRKYVSRFYYAVPEELVEKVPDFVPESAGIIKIYYASQYYDSQYFSTVVREPKGRRGEKVTDSMLKKLKEKAYFRYWRQRFNGAGLTGMEYDGDIEDL